MLLESSEPLLAVPVLIQLSRSTARKVRRNLFWAFAYNSVGMVCAALGWIHPILASALMIVSSLSVVAGSVTRDKLHTASRRRKPPRDPRAGGEAVSREAAVGGVLAASR